MSIEDVYEIPNQVFIGLPWKTIKRKYENCIEKMEKKFPLSFVIVGRDDDQSAVDLFTLIKSKIDTSSYGIFDATFGNANVSLEFGYAEATNIPKSIYLNVRKNPGSTKDRPIISDLAGQRQNHYKTEKGLLALLTKFSQGHAYTKRFEKMLQSEGRTLGKGKKKSLRSDALKIIHYLDGKSEVRREDFIQHIMTLGHKKSEAKHVIARLKHHELIETTPGRFAKVRIS